MRVGQIPIVVWLPAQAEALKHYYVSFAEAISQLLTYWPYVPELTPTLTDISVTFIGRFVKLLLSLTFPI